MPAKRPPIPQGRKPIATPVSPELSPQAGPRTPEANERFRRLLAQGRMPYDVQVQFRVRRQYADPNLSNDEVLESVLQAAQPRPSVFQRLLAPARTLAQFGYGLRIGIGETIRPTGGSEPRSVAEAIGQGFTSPLDPRDPLNAAAFAFPPGAVVTGGLRGLGQDIRAVQRGVRTVRELPLKPQEVLQRRGVGALRGAADEPIITEAAGATAAPPVPSAIPGHLAQARAIVERDRPGAINRLLDMIPLGPRQAQRQVMPGLKLRQTPVGEQVLVAWNAEPLAEASVGTRLQLSQRGHIALLESAFGKNATNVRDYKPSGVTFTGTVRAANVSGDYTGTLADILERPNLYQLSPQQRSAVDVWAAAKDRDFQAVRGAYRLEIGRAPPVEGGGHLAHVDISKGAIEVSGSESAALSRGRAKERFYDTLAERLQADSTFRPETTVAKLLQADDRNLAQMAGRQTFLEGSGGKTKLQVLEELHPKLAGQMQALQKRLTSLRGTAGRLDEKQAAAIDDFLTSPLDDANLADLQADLRPTITRGPNVGRDIQDVNAEIVAVKDELDSLRPAWRAANTKPYAFVQDVYRFFPAKEAQQVRELLKTSSNPFWKFLDRFRQTVFGGDLSPGSIQGAVSALADPVGTGRFIAGGGLKLTEEQMARWVAAHPDVATRFTEATGINPLGGVTQEFATGFIADIPKVGKAWEAANEAVFRPLMMRTMDVFEASYQGGLRAGLKSEVAAAVGADDATKLIPRINYRRFGQSQAQAAQQRALLTSVSFLTQPVAMMNDATRGLLKLGTKQTLTRSERFAVQRVVTLAATTEAIAISSNVAYARTHGLDEKQAMLDSLNPSSGKFMSLILLNGGKIGLGGPYRSIITAIMPREVEGVPFLMPFAGLANFAQSKTAPGVQLLLDEVRNRDYDKNQIRTGDFPINILQGLGYALTGSLPLTLGETARAIGKMPPSEVGAEALSQFLGTNYQPETLGNLRKRVAVEMFPIDPTTEQGKLRQKEPYLGLGKTDRAKVREAPLVKMAQDTYNETHGQTAEFVDGQVTQFYDDFTASDDLTAKRYQELGEKRQATIDGKLKGDDALSAKQFREDLKDIAEARRVAMSELVARFEKFKQEHDIEDFAEILPDEIERQKFLNEYFDPDLLDMATGAWKYTKRADRKALAENEWGAERVERWLSEGAKETHPLVQGWWDGLEAYRPYFEIRDKVLEGQPEEVKRYVKSIEAARAQGAIPGLAETLERTAPPAVKTMNEMITRRKKLLRLGDPGLDAWLFAYGYTDTTLAEQLARP